MSLGSSARASLLWSGGFTLVRDVAQFATMLLLVRLLTPTDYGSAALDQSIIGFISVFSFGTLVMHAFQLRDPADVDWQAHFKAGAVVNTSLFCVAAIIAWVFSFNEHYAGASWPLVGFATVLLVEIPATLRYRMLEVQHEWKRFRLLVLIGTLLALGAGVVVAALGGGIWALVVQVPLFGVPGMIDLFVGTTWRPDWTWSWERYRASAYFGLTRMGSALVLNGKQLVEQGTLAGTFDFATLGVFTRSTGLSTLAAGRIGSIALSALYPVITRAKPHSDQFRRYAALTLRGVVWTTVPAAAYLAVTAHDVVTLLYGAKWLFVIPLLPLAAASVGLTGMTAAANSLLLANERVRFCLILDFSSAFLGIGFALWLIPYGPAFYLEALIAINGTLFCITLTVLTFSRGISTKGAILAVLPAVIATLVASGAVLEFRTLTTISDHVWARLLVEAIVFSIGYLVVMRIAFSSSLHELLEIAPAGRIIRRGLLLQKFSDA